jgi:hypothetical protein
MILSRTQKRSAADSSNPLQQVGILQHVLNYVGPGHWCFVAEVSLWRDIYTRVANRDVYSRTKPWFEITCLPQMTAFSSVFTSPSRARLAHALGLRYDTAEHQYVAAMHADIATLEAAHELGMQYTKPAMDGAARCNCTIPACTRLLLRSQSV